MIRRALSAKAGAEQTARPLDSVLIANRGEIACRIIKTAKKMCIRTIGVYSEADSESLHVELADEAYLLGPSPSAQSYLNQEKILQIAKSAAAHAIHPGYGFLSENADFASLCSRNGITFVGPSAAAITSMGIKSKAKEIMSAAGVPVVVGYHGPNQDDSFLAAEADKIGYPVMIKAVRGGGGKGMRICGSADRFHQMLDSARRESAKAFGDDCVLIEKFVQNPRHVEVQVFGDHHGNCVHLFERDCSVQRRHQKIIEEAPGPGISPDVRQRLGEAAVRAARAVDYVGAGTVEFIYDRTDSQFYFMEMNTRLQVEHPITEYITGTDLVEWQLRVAAGEALPLTQQQLQSPRGHAFEARIYAEDTENGFIPAPGPLTHLIFPTTQSDATVRVDSGVRAGDEVSVHYDPMIAKLVVWDQTRDKSLSKLRRALMETKITGLKTNIDFLLRLASHTDFRNGDVYTDFIRDHSDELMTSPSPSEPVVRAAAFGLLTSFTKKCMSVRPLPPDLHNFRIISSSPACERVSLNHRNESYEVLFNHKENTGVYQVTVGGGVGCDMSGSLEPSTGKLVVVSEGQRKVFTLLTSEDSVTLFTGDPTANSFVFQCQHPKFLNQGSDTSDSSANGKIRSPMPGVVEHVFVKPGDRVKAGDPLLILIAMKMEYTLKSPSDGTVGSVPFPVGKSVPKGAVLVTVEN